MARPAPGAWGANGVPNTTIVRVYLRGDRQVTEYMAVWVK